MKNRQKTNAKHCNKSSKTQKTIRFPPLQEPSKAPVKTTKNPSNKSKTLHSPPPQKKIQHTKNQQQQKKNKKNPL